MQRKATQCNAKQRNATQCNAMQRKAKQSKAIQYNILFCFILFTHAAFRSTQNSLKHVRAKNVNNN